jgi:hypothetical protein
VAGSLVPICLLLLVCQEGLHHLNIDACVDQVMRVLIVKEILIDPVRFGKFSDANTVVIFVVQREEDGHLFDSMPVVVLFRPQNQSPLFRIPHSLAVCRLNFEAGSKDGHIIIGFSFVWPDAANSSSSLCHVETLFDVLFVRSYLV